MAGRQNLLDAMGRVFDEGPGNPNLSSIIVGPRGSGKTALLACIADEAAMRGWVAARVSALPNMLEDILERARAGVTSGSSCERDAPNLDLPEKTCLILNRYI